MIIFSFNSSFVPISPLLLRFSYLLTISFVFSLLVYVTLVYNLEFSFFFLSPVFNGYSITPSYMVLSDMSVICHMSVSIGCTDM